MSHAPIIPVAIVHTLAAAGWLGAMGYSLFVVQPRASSFFAGRPNGDEDLEQFLSTLARRQRWPVLSALATMALTGAILTFAARPHPPSTVWIGAIVMQSICWIAAVALFAHVSWRLWPARIFALPTERPAWRRRFRRVGLALLSLATLASIAGTVASLARTPSSLSTPTAAGLLQQP